MKFVLAWADVLTKNAIYQLCLFVMGLCLVVLAVTSASLALKEPLIIERTCYNRSLSSANETRSEVDITAFMDEALDQRFSPDHPITGGFLSDSEAAAKEKELQELTKKGIQQRVLINQISILEDQVIIDADRLIRMGEIRSVLPLRVSGRISRIARSHDNPYGLRLNELSVIENGGDDEKESQ